jgi:acetylornithine deacetylase
MQTQDILDRVDTAYCLDFLSRMVQHRAIARPKASGPWPVQMRGLGRTSSSAGRADRVSAIGRLPATAAQGRCSTGTSIPTRSRGWTVDPWGGKVDDKFIWHRRLNMKSGDAAYFCAVKTLVDARVKLRATCC